MSDDQGPYDPFKASQALRAKIKARSGALVTGKGRFYPAGSPRGRGAGTKAHPLSIEIDRAEKRFDPDRDASDVSTRRIAAGVLSGRARKDRAASRRAKVIALWHELKLPERNRAREIVRRMRDFPGGGPSRTQVDRIISEEGLRSDAKPD